MTTSAAPAPDTALPTARGTALWVTFLLLGTPFVLVVGLVNAMGLQITYGSCSSAYATTPCLGSQDDAALAVTLLGTAAALLLGLIGAARRLGTTAYALRWISAALLTAVFLSVMAIADSVS